MRILFVLILLANVWLYALGQGKVGSRPEDRGRSHDVVQELNASALKIVPLPKP